MKALLLGAVLSLAYTNGHTEIITYGSLTTDDMTNFITDTATQRQYTRFDAFALTYAELVAATQADEAWEGWTIADSQAADAFINALLNTVSACYGPVAHGAICGMLPGWIDGSFGISLTGVTDAFMYVSTAETPGSPSEEVGYVGFHNIGSVRKFDDWASKKGTDYWTKHSQFPIQFLLYRDPFVAPTPAAF